MADLPVVIIGAGPAGLMAAQVLGEAGYRVQVFDRMPAPGRKFLRAGIGGLNLTHSEPARAFLDRYEPAAAVAPWLQQLDADGVRQWAALLGVETFTGTSGRVFPVQKKASPLLRAWLRHLDSLGVELHTRHQWQGWTTQNTEGQDQQIHRFSADGENREIAACATVLALGGGSWARLGSDGAWTGVLSGAGITVKELAASNCGFDYPWSEFVAKNFAGQPLKTVKLTLFDDGAEVFSRRGESLISRNGIQGSL
ncbi:MAG TPA: TIGR03862 family flavoprotein, partial [Pseudohongiella sp.]|nr:TIGR03862 family flavoprotein [Pseudohongiella sp.]